MIIQCKQCRTKFRFDEAQMEGDGVWMRCSRCHHVFFQDNPLKISKPVTAPQMTTDAYRQLQQGKTMSPLSFEPADPARAAGAADEDVRSFLQDVMTPESTGSSELRMKTAPEPKAGLNLTDIEFSPGLDIADQESVEGEAVEEPPVLPARKKSKGLKVLLWVWSILIIIVIPAALLYFVFPQQLERYVQLGRKYMSATQPSEGQSVVTQVKLQDIRQRVVNNYVLGAVRVVEGSAVNQADYAIARIQVKAELMDAYTVVLDQRMSFAGNILSDEDLANLSEEEIMKRLALPEGRDNSNQRVVPNGRIPFMIVFTRDKPATIKTTVSIAGAEKLL